MRFRPVELPDDLARLNALFEACRTADGHAPLGEHKFLDLGAERSIGMVADESGDIVVYVHLSPYLDGWGLEVAVHPLRRDENLARRAVEAAMKAVASTGGGWVTCWVYDPILGEAVRRLGFRESRELFQLRRPLPPDEEPMFPAGVLVDRFRVGSDEPAWLELMARSFVDHPEHGFWNLDVLRDRERQAWFDPDGFLMAWQGDDLTGFCWTKLHPGRMGEIYLIAVDPQHRRRSLGRALTLAGLWHLARTGGAASGMLYVDATNLPALNLYRELGFRLDHVDRAFVLPA